MVTPENIAFQYEAAGPFRRLPAFLIDFAIRFAIMIGVANVLSVLDFLVTGLGSMLILLIFFVLSWFYGGLFETYWNGQTPGKRLMGIRVLTKDGQPINGLQAVMRNIFRFVDMMPLVPLSFLDFPPIPIVPTFLVGLITPMLNQRFQRVGDLVVGTVVVIETKGWLFGVAKLEDPRARQLAEYIPPNYEVPRSLARALATYVERRRFFSIARRREIAKHLGVPLLIQFNLPMDTSHDLLLCALYYRAFIAGRGEKESESSILQRPDMMGAVPTTAVPPPSINIVTEPITRR